MNGNKELLRQNYSGGAPVTVSVSSVTAAPRSNTMDGQPYLQLSVFYWGILPYFLYEDTFAARFSTRGSTVYHSERGP
jgi:hypothetical protein